MKRRLIQDLVTWKNKKNRKPLILRGARQVGKTWLMKEFAKTHYRKYIYINFENNERMKALFEEDYDIKRIIAGIELYSDQRVIANETLILFDEIQEVPRAITSLKYFCENAPEYHIICAGSLLGIAAPKVSSFPVGKVEFFDLYPLSFEEFLIANGKEKYVQLIRKKEFNTLKIFSAEMIDYLKLYYFVGGMPAAVSEYIESRDMAKVRGIQNDLIAGYEQDFSKHAPSNLVPKIRMLYQSIPSQLAKENKKFIYGLVKKGARAKEYEKAIMWLSDAGLIHKVHKAEVPRIPLSAYKDLKAFKIYLSDVGLLTAMAEISYKILLDKQQIFKEFKGALTEQYVLQQLLSSGRNPYYWTNGNATAEVDFLIQEEDTVLPIEVKAEKNLKSKSLKVYYEKFAPECCVRAALVDYKKEDWVLNLPLWSIDESL